MTDHESLTALLHLATNRIDDPHLEQEALRVARRRRTRRRGTAAAILAAGVTAAVIVATQVTGAHQGGMPPITQTPSTSPSSSPTQEPTAHTWPAWDPRDVDDLPDASAKIAPALPQVIDPPPTSEAIADHPLDAAVAVVVRDGRVQVLDSHGEWRTVPASGESPTASLSPKGTSVVVTGYGREEDGATIVDLDTGRSWNVSVPPGYRPYEYTAWTFLDEQTLLLQDNHRAWLVDANSGAAEPAQREISNGVTAVDPDGGILVAATWGKPNVMTDHDGRMTRQVSMSRTGRLTSVRANGNVIAGASYDGRPFALMVADRATLTPTVVLPVVDHEGNYSPGLGPVAVTDRGVVLFRFATVGEGSDIRVVAWDPSSGHMSLVSETSAPFAIGFAEDLLRDPVD